MGVLTRGRDISDLLRHPSCTQRKCHMSTQREGSPLPWQQVARKRWQSLVSPGSPQDLSKAIRKLEGGHPLPLLKNSSHSFN